MTTLTLIRRGLYVAKGTKAQRDRRSFLIHELARLSRNGWRDARPVDYLPLEAELKELERRIRG